MKHGMDVQWIAMSFNMSRTRRDTKESGRGESDLRLAMDFVLVNHRTPRSVLPAASAKLLARAVQP
jgi:hypothetical protein